MAPARSGSFQDVQAETKEQRAALHMAGCGGREPPSADGLGPGAAGRGGDIVAWTSTTV